MICSNVDCGLTVCDNQTSFGPDEIMTCKLCGYPLEENELEID